MTITNAQVRQALIDGLKTRWEPAAQDQNGYLPEFAPSCQLCVTLFDCTRCPVALLDDRCLRPNSIYKAWSDRHTKEHAIAMRDLLRRCLKHFFGEDV